MIRAGCIAALLLLTMIAAPARAQEIGPDEVAGDVITALSVEEFAAIVGRSTYTFTGENHGGWEILSPDGFTMFATLEGCGGDRCTWLRVRCYWALGTRQLAVIGALTYEQSVPPAQVAVFFEGGQGALSVGRDVYLAPGVTTGNIIANLAAVEAMSRSMTQTLLQFDPGVAALWNAP